MAAWAFCATEHYPVPVSSQHHYCSFSLCVQAACLSSLGCRTQELPRGDFIYSSLKSEPIMSTDVKDREENKREIIKDIQEWAEGERCMWKTSDTEFRKRKQALRSTWFYSQHITNHNEQMQPLGNSYQKVYEAAKTKHFLWDYLLQQKPRFNIIPPPINWNSRQDLSLISWFTHIYINGHFSKHN